MVLKVPAGWKVTPSEAPFEFALKDENQSLSFSVQPGPGAMSGSFEVEAEAGSRKINQDMITIRYPHIPPQTVFPTAGGRLLRFDLKKIEKRIGYIMGPGDQIPVALKQIGYSVTMLSDDDLKSGDLGAFDVIIAGVRSYNTRAALRANHRRLLDFVERGGTYIVQYMTPRQDGNGKPWSVSIHHHRRSCNGRGSSRQVPLAGKSDSEYSQQNYAG